MTIASIVRETGHWVLYLIECRSGAYYAGITNDLDRRYTTHCAGLGAKYTRANPPVRLVGFTAFADRVEASKAEYQIKRLPRAAKRGFLKYQAPRPAQRALVVEWVDTRDSKSRAARLSRSIREEGTTGTRA